MTTQEFLAAVEAYYGRYTNRAVREAVLAYLAAVEENLKDLYLQVIEGFGIQYRCVPDVAVIEKARRELEEARRQRDPGGVYRGGKRLGHMDGGRFIPDLSGLGPERIRLYAAQAARYESVEGFARFLAEHAGQQSPSEPGKLALIASEANGEG